MTIPSQTSLDWGEIDADEVNPLYRAFLGRDAEPEVIRWFKARALFDMVWDMAASDEVGHKVLLALVQKRPLPHLGLPDSTLEQVDAWLVARLQVRESSPGEPLTWPHLLSRLYAQPVLNERMLNVHGSLFSQALADLALLRKVGRRKLVGKIEFVNQEFISGWASDLTGETDRLMLEVRHAGLLIAHGMACSLRPDVLRNFGGNGMAGFRIRWSPAQFPPGQPLMFSLHEAGTGVQLGNAYRFENSFFDQLSVSQRLAKEFEEIRLRLDHLAGMVPQSLGYSAFPLEHYDLYRRTHRVPPPPHLSAQVLGHPAPPGNWRVAAPPPAALATRFTVVVDARAGDPIALRRSVDTLREQTLPLYRLLLVGSAPAVEAAAQLLEAGNPQVQHAPDPVAALAEWPAATATETAAPEWTVLLEAGDLADPNLLAWLAEAVAQHPEAQGLFWDEDRIEQLDGSPPGRLPRRVDPILRRAFCADSMLEYNGVGTSLAIRSSTLRQLTLQADEHRAALLDLNAREALIWAVQALSGRAWCHVPHCLHSRSQPPAEQPRLHQLVARQASTAQAAWLPSTWHDHRWQRVADPLWDAAPKPLVRWQPRQAEAMLSVIIPTRDHGDLVNQCVTSLRQLALFPQALDIIIIDNGSAEPETLRYLADGVGRSEFRVLRVDEPFNWSRLNNLGAASARGPLLLFLNNDTRMLTPEWDSALRGLLERPDLGAVGARLLYEDMTLQHAGVMFGYEDFVGHEAVLRPHNDEQALTDTQLSREVSAVTGAFLACRTELFEASGGFEANELSVTFNDVDWCLRVSGMGYKILYAPLLSLIHYESKSRGFDFMSPEKQARADYERQALLKRLPFSALRDDPFRPPLLSGWANEKPSLR